ncbi:ABC transporter ATP-binding protein [Brevibacillus sp. B_LB10_24]|uniref:ABC transporter ATP-binding protein n=1 Tax=Brevibacillus sp. B_LB10_24 TaxID=3380645 RepID=UPI0038BAAB97
MAIGDSLSVVHATKYYKKFRAVDDVSLTVHHGEFLTILGPSGSGKTTLLKLIAGFEQVSSGSILLNDQDITVKKAYEREVGMLFQNYALFPHMTVFDNIAYPLRLRKIAKADINHMVLNILKLVHLEQYDARYPKQLSGGQQQRVALARAIVFNPPLLLLDEPLGALDKNLRQQMQLEIKQIQQKVGITTISVTHDQEEALTMSDRICVMNHGRIEQIDTPENLYKRPENRFVAEFIGEINLIHGELRGVDKGCAKVRILGDLIAEVEAGEEVREKKNQSWLMAVRPENLQIAKEPSQFQNTVSVEVSETIYVGEAIKAKVKTKAGQEILVKIPAYMSDSISCGKEVLLGWNSKDATLLADEVIA